MLHSTFLAVTSQEDVLNDELTFAPQFTHQVFGEKETIFGYKNLKIKVNIISFTQYLIGVCSVSLISHYGRTIASLCQQLSAV